MTEKDFHPALLNPFVLWTDLTMKATEMMVSSGQILGDRVGEITRAAATPAAESAVDVATRMQQSSFQIMSRAWQQWFSAIAAMTTMTAAPSFGQLLQRQDRLVKSFTQPPPAHDAAAADEVAHAAPKRAVRSAGARRTTRVSRTRVSASRG